MKTYILGNATVNIHGEKPSQEKLERISIELLKKVMKDDKKRKTAN